MAKFTDEQLKVIEAKGKTIVSASAGSGKTTVMIEKILRLVLSGVNVNEILAVTFTKKAAAQMKDKLRKKLIEAINSPSSTPQNKKILKEQLLNVPSADISTIHSLCSRIIKTHFFAAGVSSDFSIISNDDADGAELQRKALDLVFERAYEENDEDFLLLLSIYWRKKKDAVLRETIISTYRKLRERAGYRQFLEDVDRYNKENFEAISLDLLNALQDQVKDYLNIVSEERKYFVSIGHAKYVDVVDNTLELIYKIIETKNYYDIYEIAKYSFSRKPPKSNKDTALFLDHVDNFTTVRDKLKKLLEKYIKNPVTEEEALKKYEESGKIAKALSKYILLFDDEYKRIKDERSLLDYNDLEHITLDLLNEPNIVEEIRSKYSHVFVDEYQDVNPVQERILSTISGDNVFLVGDVKQSIYGFRGSKSIFFLQKQIEFANEKNGNVIYLKKNFRSADEILDAVNEQFNLAMTKDTSSIDYKGTSFMEAGGLYEDGKGRVEIRFIPEKAKEDIIEDRDVYSVKKAWDEGKDVKSSNQENMLVKSLAQIIKNEHKSSYYDVENKEYKKVQYSDIAILVRKNKGDTTNDIILGLSEAGIPVTSSASVNICLFSEIKTLIDILSLIDNEEQDIPLCSALMSSMGDLTPQELADIRLEYKDEYYFRNCCKKYMREKKDNISFKLKNFYDYFHKIRTYSTVSDAGELLNKILSETKMEASLLSKDNGAGCLKRIHRFIEESLSPEPLSVHEFLDRLKALDYNISYSENGGEDAVKVMTIHASKGLEFPIVILADMNTKFHAVDKSEVFVNDKYGLAPKYYDSEKMVYSSTIIREICEEDERRATISDELNLLYVALTRAKYGLYMLFTKEHSGQDVKNAKCFADFVDLKVWDKYITNNAIYELPYEEKTQKDREPDKELKESIISAFSWEYPFKGTENIAVKSSASTLINEISKKNDFVKAENNAPVQVVFDDSKDFTATGTAYHAFLEHFNFNLLLESDDDNDIQQMVIGTIEKIKENNLMTNEQIKLLNEKQLFEIIKNPVFKEIAGMQVLKEQEFMVKLPYKDIYEECELNNCQDEEIIFQGFIDMLAISEDEVRVIDYKFSSGAPEYLKNHYLPQLKLYKKAVQKIMKVNEENIHCTIVNIKENFVVDMDI